MARIAPFVVLWLLAGCASDQAFDSASAKLSAYCARNAGQGLTRQ